MKRKFSIAILILFSLWLLLLVVGCGRKVVPSTTIVRKDSVIEKTVEKIVHLPGDTVTIEKRIECDQQTLKPKSFEEKISKGIQNLDVAIDNDGNLRVVSDCDSLLKIRDKIIQNFHTENKKETIVVTEFKVYWYDKYLSRPLAILFLLVAAFFAGKIYLKPSTLLKS